MTQPDEFVLIRRLTGQRQSNSLLYSRGVRVGIGDDAAVAEVTPGFQLVMSCDTMVEGIHFLPSTMKSSDIGFKAMASNISDMAAMGAVPRYALVCLTAPKTVSLAELDQLYDGLYACAELYEVAVVGGDTTSTPGGLTVSVTIVGEVESNRALLRSAAVDGDVVFITGNLGCSAGGLDFLLSENRHTNESKESPMDMQKIFHMEKLLAAHQRPLPQVKAGRLLLQSGVCHALNDISDGLASEAWEIAEASKCGILLDESHIPRDTDLLAYAELRSKNVLEWILYGGEDYQLIGTLSHENFADVQLSFAKEGLELSRIGTVHSDFIGVQMKMMDGSTKAIEKKGYNHFG